MRVRVLESQRKPERAIWWVGGWVGENGGEREIITKREFVRVCWCVCMCVDACVFTGVCGV